MADTHDAEKTFNSFAEFYPFYLSEHKDPRCRNLHFFGSSSVILLVAYIIFSGKLAWLIALPIIGYGCAWIGHFGFEKNRPATFKYPLYSFIGDWVMYKDFLSGQLNKKLAALEQ